MLVLVVDDEFGIAEVMAAVLRDAAYDVVVAYDGVEALHAMRHGSRPSCAVIDLMMPGMSGQELIAAMRGDRDLQGIPVILMSGFLRAEHGSTLGVAEVLAKPFTVAELLDVVGRVLAAPPSAEQDG